MECITTALELLQDGLQAFPDCAKLWMMKGQILEQEEKLDEAREAYLLGTKKCPDSIPLWTLVSRIEEKRGQLTKARSTLDKARLKNPKNDKLWMESIRIEIRAGLKDIAEPMLAKGITCGPRLHCRIKFHNIIKQLLHIEYYCLQHCKNVPLPDYFGRRPFSWKERLKGKQRAWTLLRNASMIHTYC